MRILRFAILMFATVTMAPLFSQSPKCTGAVTPTVAEFTIPLQRPANDIWTWNRPETPDNVLEYSWSVTAVSGTEQYNFGFFYYKFPERHVEKGRLEDLLSTGQSSVFKEDSAGSGTLLPDAVVAVTVENNAILVRITDPDLIRLIFHNHPATVAIHVVTQTTDYQVVQVNYRD